MKVKDLIEQLQHFDGEAEVFAAPMVIMPIFEFSQGVKLDDLLKSKRYEKSPMPETEYPIIEVGSYRKPNLTGWDPDYIILGFEMPDNEINREDVTQ